MKTSLHAGLLGFQVHNSNRVNPGISSPPGNGLLEGQWRNGPKELVMRGKLAVQSARADYRFLQDN